MPRDHERQVSCIFCGNAHHNDKCDRIRSLGDRKAYLNSENKCLICLRFGHKDTDCFRKGSFQCYNCKKFGHNRCLCPTLFLSAPTNNYTNRNKPKKSTHAPVTFEHDKKSESPKTTTPTPTQHQPEQNPKTPIPPPFLLPPTNSGADSAITPVLLVPCTHSVEVSSPPKTGSSVSAGFVHNKNALLLTGVAEIQNPHTNDIAKVHIFLDTGAQKSFISSSIANNLQLPASEENMLNLQTFGSLPVKTKSKLVEFRLLLRDGSNLLCHANTADKLIGSLTRPAISNDDKAILTDLPPEYLADQIPTEELKIHPQILLGSDYLWDLLELNKIKLPSGLYLIASKLGYFLTGLSPNGQIIDDADKLNNSCAGNPKAEPPDKIEDIETNMLVVAENTPKLEEFWSLENLGIVDSPHLKEDEYALTKFNSTIEFKDGRYAVQWPWRTPNPELPHNYNLALGRLKNLMKRFRHNPELYQKMNDIIMDQLQKGIIEKIDPQLQTQNLIHYLPFQPVLTPERNTTKCRIVYDASSKATPQHNSLNDTLLRGPVILPAIIGLLIQFRMYQFALIADVEKAFLQVSLQSSQRDITRFLWIKNVDAPLDDENLVTYRFCRVPFGMTSSPFLLGGTIQHHLLQKNNAILQEVCHHIYVDNLVISTHSFESAQQIFTEARNAFSEMNMNLRCWNSNDTKLLDCFPESTKSNKMEEKVLGIPWKPQDDTLHFACQRALVDGNEATTKRRTLHTVASVFDPLGLISPITLHGKCFLQKLWSENMDWDTTLTQSQLDIWHKILEIYNEIPTLVLPRCLQYKPGVPTEIHVFSDASNKAYGCAAYLRFKTEIGWKCHLLFAKSRIAPLRIPTLPRLELLGILIGARCGNLLEKELKLHNVQKFLWTDSTCNLQWLTSTKPMPVFVKNRVKELQTTNYTFKHVPGCMNPADLTTRGATVPELVSSALWWHGPSWLSCDVDKWPVSTITITPEQFQNVKPDSQANSFAIGVAVPKPTELSPLSEYSIKEKPKIHQIMDCTEFSTYRRLIRVTATVLRAASLFKQKRGLMKSTTSQEVKLSVPLKAEEFRRAKQYWDIAVQIEHFSPVLKNLKKLKNMATQLKLSENASGVLVCNTRLSNVSLSTKLPKFLPKKHHVTNLIIQDIHERNFHSGVTHTLASLRSQYWVPHGRSSVKFALKGCNVCKKFSASSYKLPAFPDLPDSRTAVQHPFSHISLDYFGPFKVKTSNKHTEKIWICIFACLKIRAIHLEVITDLSTETFLQAFRRFTARRGCPVYIVSDNALQYRLGHKTIREAHKHTLPSYASEKEIEWKFLPIEAPWMGGVHERLIRIVKQALQKTMGTKSLTLNQFTTLIVELEQVMNRRPLYYISGEQEDPVPLSPQDFLCLNPTDGLPIMDLESLQDPDYVPKPSKSTDLIDSWKQGQVLVQKFWNIWQKQYLPMLRLPHFSKDFHKQKQVDSIPQKGDVVLIEKKETTRNNWNLGRIEEVFTSKDGNCRSCKVRRNKKVKTYPVKHLYPLEFAPRTKAVSLVVQLPLILWTILTCLVCVAGSTTQFQCPADHSDEPVHVPICHNMAYGVWKANEIYCWTKLTCPVGQTLATNGKCVQQPAQCNCPAWALGCNPAMLSTKNLLRDEDKESIKENEQPSICAKEASPLCAKNQVTEQFFQLQLPDNSTFEVETLNLKAIQTPANTFQCIGNGPTGGTPPYCAKHKCDSDGGKHFCFYQMEEFSYYVSNLGSSIPVYAWGRVNVTYYPHKDEKEHSVPITVNLKCVKGGIIVECKPEVQHVQICVPPYCFDVSSPPNVLNFQFPPEVNIVPHTVKIKCWHQGILVKESGIDCPALPYCETIDCYLCIIRWTNPYCLSRTELIIGLIVLFISLYFLKTALKILTFVLKLLLKVCMCVRKIGRKSQQRARVHLTVITTASTIFTVTFGCSDVTTLTATSTSCMKYKNKTGLNLNECILTEATRLAMVPEGQTTCLMLHNNENGHIGSLKITVNQIRLSCQPSNKFFTRSFQMDVVSSFRCHSMGACSGSKCQAILPDTKISEFDDNTNNAPGTSYCTSVPGCWANQCFLCSNACLFFRTFAKPTSDTIFEVFTCPIWTVSVDVTATFELLVGKSNSIDLKLTPGVKKTWKNLQITLIGATLPPAPILGTTFLTDGTRTAVATTSPAQQPVSGTIGSLQCKNRDDAQQFNPCYLAKDLCTCYPQDDRIGCNCYNLELEQLLLDKHRTLPLRIYGLNLQGTGTNLYAHYSSIASLEIQVQMKELRLFYMHSPTTCTITTKPLEGCYSCLTGATLSLTCTTNPDGEDTLAEVVCPNTLFSTSCTPKGKTATVTLAFKEATINEKCFVYCPGGKTEAEIKGTLMFVDKPPIGTHNGTNGHVQSSSQGLTEWPLSGFDIFGLFKFLYTHWYLVVLAVILGLILICCFPTLLTCFSQLGSYANKKFSDWYSKFKERVPFLKKPLTKTV